MSDLWGPAAGGPEPEPERAPQPPPPPAAPPAASSLQVALRAPLAALTLLTIAPVSRAAQANLGAREVAASAPFFPLIGAVMGVLLGLVAHGLAVTSGPFIAGAVVAILLAILTGALHLDGLADCADALGARGGSRERRLEIMRDSSTGAYGTAAIAGWFILVGAAVTTIPPDDLVFVLAFSLAVPRAYAVAHARTLGPARPGGLGAGFVVSSIAVGWTLLALAPLLVAALLLFPDGGAAFANPHAIFQTPRPLAILGAVVGAQLASAIVTILARQLLGGRTGDTLGATIALGEALSLLGAVIMLGLPGMY